mmetsp:Transcript_39943/g.158977  ORF Transcript_39943/g.158977 Transcript_39943/m.158977 type:complete len:260 (+) Transcript_39943:210-989(+)
MSGWRRELRLLGEVPMRQATGFLELRARSPINGQAIRCVSKWAPWEDHYTQLAVRERMRSRAAYKLAQMQKSTGMLGRRSYLLDLGAAPGGWTLAAKRFVDTDPSTSWDSNAEALREGTDARYGKIVAIDLLRVEEIPGVTFVQHDLLDATAVEKKIKSLLHHRQHFDVVLSDMAPSTTGDKQRDHFKIIRLVESALQIAISFLPPSGGVFLAKIFRGSQEREFLDKLRRSFIKVKTIKPQASRKQANEIYVYCEGRTQ